MKKAKQVDLIVVRVWKTGKDIDVFALFPEITADNNGYYCSCYDHIGQHGSADYLLCIRSSRPATKREAAPLLKELRLIGYNLLVIKRATPKMHALRILSARGADGIYPLPTKEFHG